MAVLLLRVKKQWARTFYRPRYLVRTWWRLFKREIYLLVSERATQLQLLAVPATLWLSYEWFGWRRTLMEVTGIVVALAALGVAGLAFLVVSAARGIYYLPREQRAGGIWYGNSHVYDVPQPVFTRVFGPEDNLKSFKFFVPEALEGSFVHFRVECENSIIKATVMLDGWKATEEFIEQFANSNTGLRLGKGKTAVLVALIPPNASLAAIRVSILSWGLEDVPR